jgi:iron complex transport system substrate-binding protein
MYLFCDSSEIVGRTQNCNYPPVALTNPIVNNYPPDLEKILLLKPDLLITKDGMLSIEQANAIEKMGIPVYFQTYDSVSSIFKGIKTLSSLTNHADKGIRVADSLEDILKKEHVNVSGNPPKVLMLISKDSYFCFGKNTYASDILRQCGAVNAVDSIFENPYPILSAEYILKTNPDLILGGPEVGLDKDFFELHPELKRTKAFKIKQYYSINEDYLSRPGPRVVEAVRAIRALLEKENSSPQR